MRLDFAFDLNGLVSIHVITNPPNDSVAIACYSEEDDQLISTFEALAKENQWSSNQIVEWCIINEFQYQILNEYMQ